MDVVKIGNYSFNAEVFKDRTLKDAVAFFASYPESVVAQAWKIVNPKVATKKKTVKK